MSETGAESTLLVARPAMFRNSPVLFILCLGLIFAYGVGLLLLLIWWLSTKASSLTITTRRTILRQGLLSKKTSEVLHLDVRNIQISQGIFQRMFGVGTLGISSAGQGDVEIQFAGITDPEGAKGLIDRHR